MDYIKPLDCKDKGFIEHDTYLRNGINNNPFKERVKKKKHNKYEKNHIENQSQEELPLFLKFPIDDVFIEKCTISSFVIPPKLKHEIKHDFKLCSNIFLDKVPFNPPCKPLIISPYSEYEPDIYDDFLSPFFIYKLIDYLYREINLCQTSFIVNIISYFIYLFSYTYFIDKIIIPPKEAILSNFQFEKIANIEFFETGLYKSSLKPILHEEYLKNFYII